MTKNEKLTVWNGRGLERLTREEFTERALNTPYHYPNYLDYEFFDLTGHILLWEYIRTHINSLEDPYHIFENKAKGICFIDNDNYRAKVRKNDSCFACVYARDKLKKDEKLMCKYCPLDWECQSCIEFNSLYKEFKQSETVEEARKLALQIRDLPVKQGVIVR